MTLCTPTYLIPYQSCTDRPCDFDDVACDAATVIETNLNRIDAIINRTATTIPMAVVQMTSQPVYNASATSPPAYVFDTVLADTDNMFSPSDASFVTINTSGYYIVEVQVQWHPIGNAAVTCSASAEFDMDPGINSTVPTAGGLFNELRGVYFRTDGHGSYSIAGMPMPFPAGSRIFVPFTDLVQDSMTLRLVELSAVWVGDLS